VSRIHPTGAAQFYSGTATPLTSLFRESTALTRARASIAALAEDVRRIEAQVGSAPISLSYGEILWTELDAPGTDAGVVASKSPADPQGETVDLGGEYDPTGEFRLSDLAEAEEIARERREAVAAAENEGMVHPDDEVSPADAEDAPESPDDVDADEPTYPRAREMREPALLRDIHIEGGAEESVLTLGRSSDLSPVVVEALRRHGAPVEALHEARTLARQPETEEAALSRVREFARVYLPGYSFESVSLVGCFVSPAQVVLDDFLALGPFITKSDLVAALAGDDEAKALTARDLPEGDPYDRQPEAERGAGDLDVAELDVVDAAAAGHSFFVNAGLGTRPDAVVASMAADAAASGKFVAVLPGNALSRSNLLGSLEDLGLEDLVADFTNLTAIPMRLRTGLRLTADDLDDEAILAANEKLTDSRAKLTDYLAALHEPVRGGESVHELLSRLADLTSAEDGPRTRVRLAPEVVERLSTPEERESARTQVADAVSLASRSYEGSPWRGARLFADDDARDTLTHVETLSGTVLPAVLEQSQRVAAETGLARATTMDEWRAQIALFDDVADSLDAFVPDIFERSAQDMVIATASKQWRESHGHIIGASDRRRLRKQAEDYIRPGHVPNDLHAALSEVQRLRNLWYTRSEPGSYPSLPEGLTAIRSTAAQERAALDHLTRVLPNGDSLTTMPLTDLNRWMKSLAEHSDDLEDLPRRNQVARQISDAGLSELVNDLNSRSVPSDAIADELELARITSLIEQAISASPALSAIAPTQLTDLVSAVSELDLAHVDQMSGPVRAAAVSHMRHTISDAREDTMALDYLLAEGGVQVLREAASSFGPIVKVARPVWVISALTAAQVIPARPWIDLLIVDGTETMPLAALIPTLARARQVIVVGRAGVAELAGAASGGAKADGELAGTALARVLPMARSWTSFLLRQASVGRPWSSSTGGECPHRIPASSIHLRSRWRLWWTPSSNTL